MIHFHEFMQQIQHDLALLQCKNPLAVIAQTFKQHYDVIYLDELHIMDIGTASTIFGLMQACFAKHIWLIISSNYAPTELCTNPLWQARFATIVSLLHTKLQVIPLSTKDYRYNSQFNNQLLMLYDTQQDYSIWQEATQHRLERLFYHYSNSSAKTNTAATTSAEQSSSMSGIINICQRRIAYIKASTIVIWFEFDVICGSPRAVADYLDLSKQYQVMIICHAHADSSNNLMRFVQLIDVWYEQKLILVLQSLVPITQLVANSPRTLSRLYEMQSIDYSKSNSIDAIR
jgi:cell division protein ZapE